VVTVEAGRVRVDTTNTSDVNVVVNERVSGGKVMVTGLPETVIVSIGPGTVVTETSVEVVARKLAC
jgi:hypothetical protein